MTDLENYRRQKDDYFKNNPQSPIEDADFSGLKYFLESWEFVFDAPIDIFEKREIVQLETSTGDTQPYVKYARASFTVAEQPCELTLFAQAYEHNPESFFIPFRDASSGKESYGTGRYLEAALQADGTVRLDFNYAYNPFCAYSERWRCPLPPFENHLKAAIHAGEKSYP